MRLSLYIAVACVALAPVAYAQSAQQPSVPILRPQTPITPQLRAPIAPLPRVVLPPVAVRTGELSFVGGDMVDTAATAPVLTVRTGELSFVGGDLVVADAPAPAIVVRTGELSFVGE